MYLKKAVLRLRLFRVFHRYLGLSLALFLFISAITGVLLALKKDVSLLQPETLQGSSEQMKDWLPMQELAAAAGKALVAAHPEQADNLIDRIDVRPSKGVVKVLFEKAQWEVQVDAATGEVLHIARRHSDWIEALHDGSIISDAFKVGSMSLLGIGLLFLICTGLWLWYGPKQYRRLKSGYVNESEQVPEDLKEN